MSGSTKCDFEYGGKQYRLQVTLYRELLRFDLIVLDNETIREIIIQNSINNLYVTGLIQYSDWTGHVTKIIGSQHKYCEIILSVGDIQHDQERETVLWSDKNEIRYRFIIDNIQILEREGVRINYCINLVGLEWYNLNSNWEFSSYDSDDVDKKNPLDYITRALSDAKLVCGETMTGKDKVEFKTRFEYITNTNDTINTAIQYILHKTIYDRVYEDSLKFIYLNPYTRKYEILDVSKPDTFGSLYSVTIQMDNNESEIMCEGKEVDLGSVVRMTGRESFLSFADHILHTYDLNTNKFDVVEKNTHILDEYFNTKYVNPHHTDKPMWIPYASLKYKNDGSIWNNDQNIYGNMVGSLIDMDALMIDIVGNIFRKPSDIVEIGVTHTKPSDGDEVGKKEYLSKFNQIDGKWFISSVRSVIQPSQGNLALFRQTVLLFRNYMLIK